MANIKAINLTDDTYEIWKKKFKDTGDFSGWIQQKLIEEQNKEDSPEFLRNKIIQYTADLQKIQGDMAIVQKRLDLKMDMERAKAELLIKELEHNGSLTDRNYENLKQRISARIEFKYKIRDIRIIEYLSKLYSNSFMNIKEDERPKPHIWITDELIAKAKEQIA
jgi:hypothetical protein